MKKWNKHGNRAGEYGKLDAVGTLLSAPFFAASSLARCVTRAELLAASLAPPSARSVTDFACPVCLEVLRNPVVLSCAHRFCFSCVATAALYAPDRPPQAPPSAPVPRGLRCDCPVCRKPQLLDDGALRVDPALDDFVREHFAAALAPPPQSSLTPAEEAQPALDRVRACVMHDAACLRADTSAHYALRCRRRPQGRR